MSAAGKDAAPERETPTQSRAARAAVRPKGNLSGGRKWFLIALLGVPILIVLGKVLDLPLSDSLSRVFSLVNIPDEMHARVRYLLFVPLGALFVVFTRLTLGIRLLGPFRSILIAVAFQITGILFGLVFLIMVVAVVVVLRPLLKTIQLPYFARVSVILSTVAAIMVLALLVGNWLGVESLHTWAYFPVVVLSLTGEGFARTLGREGTRSAMWRGAMTVLVAILITLISSVPRVQQLLLRFPEFLVLQIGLIVVIAEFFDLRLLQWINPPPRRPKKRRTGRRRKGKGKGGRTTTEADGAVGAIAGSGVGPAKPPADSRNEQG